MKNLTKFVLMTVLFRVNDGAIRCGMTVANAQTGTFTFAPVSGTTTTIMSGQEGMFFIAEVSGETTKIAAATVTVTT